MSYKILKRPQKSTFQGETFLLIENYEKHIHFAKIGFTFFSFDCFSSWIMMCCSKYLSFGQFSFSYNFPIDQNLFLLFFEWEMPKKSVCYYCIDRIVIFHNIHHELLILYIIWMLDRFIMFHVSLMTIERVYFLLWEFLWKSSK